MGARHSKVKITVPPSPTCFPNASPEEEEEICQTIAKIGESHIQAVQIASWITAAVCPSYGGTFAFSAATYLLTFIIHRLSTVEVDSAPSAPGGSNSNSKAALKRANSKDNSKSLESALISSKVASAIAKKTVSELRAKMYVIKNRLQRLQLDGQISWDDRRLEVVPAIQTCEEVLQLFYDPEHVLRSNPIASIPILVPFSGVFLAIAELSIKLIPSYKAELTKEMRLMSEVLEIYKEASIKSRTDALGFRAVQPGSMIDAISGSFDECRYRLNDSFLSYKTIEDCDSDDGRSYSSPTEAMNDYKSEIEDKYNKLFEPALQSLSKFSGFRQKETNNNDQEAASAPPLSVSNFGKDDGDDEHGSVHSYESDDDDTVVENGIDIFNA